MNHQVLTHVFIFLSAACLIVPLASRFKLSSVLGYLLVGIMIGPFGFHLIQRSDSTQQIAEFGIIMMLFLIGLELSPTRLWNMRKLILGLGGLQMIVTTSLLTLVAVGLSFPLNKSVAVSLALACSSTALVLQILQEKNLLHTAEGEASFAVLLLQDIAVIPTLIILPLLAQDQGTHLNISEAAVWLRDYPRWMHALIVLGILGSVMTIGHFLSRYLFWMIAKSNIREVFTAIALALIVGTTLLMESIGLSPGLGAFIAGVVLANSEYKRTLETDIEPFKGLLLGLFFISVGMGMNFHFFETNALHLCLYVLGLLTIKGIVLFYLGRIFGLGNVQSVGFALALGQAGEFAFVLLQYSENIGVLSNTTGAFFTMVVALSMALTPIALIIYQQFLVPRLLTTLPTRSFDTIQAIEGSIILAGYGRFGQVIGRFLNGLGVPLTILENDPEQIELLRKFGFKAYYGDAARLDILRSAGAANAKVLIVAVDDPIYSLSIVKMAREEFPHLRIYARARDRRHAYDLHKLNAYYFRRETFDSALHMAEDIVIDLGHNKQTIRAKGRAFRHFDEKSLQHSFEFFEEESALILFSRQVNGELEQILRSDQEYKIHLQE